MYPHKATDEGSFLLICRVLKCHHVGLGTMGSQVGPSFLLRGCLARESFGVHAAGVGRHLLLPSSRVHSL